MIYIITKVKICKYYFIFFAKICIIEHEIINKIMCKCTLIFNPIK